MSLIIYDILIEYINRASLIKTDVDDKIELTREYNEKSVTSLVLLDKLHDEFNLLGGVTRK